MREGCVWRGGASKDMSCRKDVFSVGASKNKSSHAGRMCLAGGPSRMQDGVARALPEQDGRFT